MRVALFLGIYPEGPLVVSESGYWACGNPSAARNADRSRLGLHYMVAVGFTGNPLVPHVWRRSPVFQRCRILFRRISTRTWMATVGAVNIPFDNIPKNG